MKDDPEIFNRVENPTETLRRLHGKRASLENMPKMPFIFG
jgi:hypothetical protein